MQRIWLIAQRFGLGFQPICTLPYLQAAIAQGSKDFSPQQKQKLSECQKTFRSLWSLDAEQELVLLFRIGYPKRIGVRSLRRPIEQFILS